MKVIEKPRPERRRIPQAPCPFHGAARVHDGKPCDAVGLARNRFVTWRCGRWQHADAAVRRIAVK